MPTDYLEGMPEKSLSCHFTTNVNAWSSLNTIWTLTGTVFYGQMKLKLNFSATNTQDRLGVKSWMPVLKITCMYVWWRWRFCDVVGCFSSKGPGKRVRVHGIMNSMKYQDIFYFNLAAPVRKLKLGRRWIIQQDSDPKHTSNQHKNG